MRTLIAIPSTGEMNHRFVESLLNLEKVGDVDIKIHASSLVYDARNALAGRAVQGKYDYVLWLDSDMVFKPDILEKMIEHIGEYDALTAVYHKRRPPYTPLVYKKVGYSLNDKGEFEPVAEEWEGYPKDGVFQCDACGFGCVLTKVSALEKMHETTLPFSPMLGFGEDLSFCLRMKKMGMKLGCDPSVQLGHVGEIVIDGETRERWLNVLKDEILQLGGEKNGYNFTSKGKKRSAHQHGKQRV